MKPCTRCGLPKPLTAFRMDKRRGTYRSWCMECDRAYNRAYGPKWRAAHPDYMREYWQTHERPRKPSKRDVAAERQRTTRRHEALARRQNPVYAAAKRARFARILATVRPALTSGQE